MSIRNKKKNIHIIFSHDPYQHSQYVYSNMKRDKCKKKLIIKFNAIATHPMRWNTHRVKNKNYECKNTFDSNFFIQKCVKWISKLLSKDVQKEIPIGFIHSLGS